jgi:glycosyltransferase involved in cell wall biosynthesis
MHDHGLVTAADGRQDSSRSLRIAMLATPWTPVPPPAFGGVEAVVALLTEELVRRGHSVTLFCAPGSRSAAAIRPVLAAAAGQQRADRRIEVDHVATAFDMIDAEAAAGRPFDVIHDHCAMAGLAFANRIAGPLVHTLHRDFSDERAQFYTRHGHKAVLVGISGAQLESGPAVLRGTPVIPNPIAVRDWPLALKKDNYLLWIGRIAAFKGPHHAIAAAQRAEVPLRLAGVVWPGQEAFFVEEVERHLDGRQTTYIGEVGGDAKQQLFARARAVLMPIEWEEPFGLVMVEALACGTPVIAFARGAAREIIVHGVNGFLVDDVDGMAQAVQKLGTIEPRACRQSVADRYDAALVAAAYEALYRRAIAGAEHAGAIGDVRAQRDRPR